MKSLQAGAVLILRGDYLRALRRQAIVAKEAAATPYPAGRAA